MLLLLLLLMLLSLYMFRTKDTSSSYQTMTFLCMHTSISSMLWIILDNLFLAFNPNITAKSVLFRFFFFKRRHFTTTITNHLLLQPLQMKRQKITARRYHKYLFLPQCQAGYYLLSDSLLLSPSVWSIHL
jgi:hypothetical protein